MIAGLEDVTAGTDLIDGVDVTDLAPRHRTSRWSSRATRSTRT
jgi:ABC-type sugar transport system ATPase subunit